MVIRFFSSYGPKHLKTGMTDEHKIALGCERKNDETQWKTNLDYLYLIKELQHGKFS
jgi:hypothetical protein